MTDQDVNPDFRDMFAALCAAEVRFLVVGGYAVMRHTVPRYTKDIDILVECSAINAERVFAALTDFGAPLSELSVQDLQDPKVVFQIGVPPNRIDILTGISGVEFQMAWGRRLSGKYGDVPVAFLCLDDILAAKRAAGRPHDLRDVEWLERAKRQFNGGGDPSKGDG